MNVGTKLTKSGALAHLSTLDDVVEDYIARFQDKFDTPSEKHSAGHDDPVVDFCKEAKTLTTAIERAVAGRRRDGKMFSKGSCVPWDAKTELTKRLLARRDKVVRAKTFEQLYDIVAEASPKGIGYMSKYAVSERIGAYLGIKPEHFLYVHAGPLKGWKRLNGTRAKEGRVPVTDLPPPLRRIELYHVENLLCEYHELLHPGMLR
jgi:hypothetical protein